MENITTNFDLATQSKKELLQILYAYQQAIDSSIISSITDEEGIIIYANKKFCEVAKYSARELIGEDHRIINSGYHSKTFFEKMWTTITEGNVWQGEIKNKAKDGTFYWVDTVIFSIKDNDGKIIQYLSLRMLINEKKQAEADKIEYVKSIEELIFKTSHEVRQPVAHILGISNLLDRSISSPNELKTLIGYMKHSAQSLDKFTRELTLHLHELTEKNKNRKENKE